MEPGRRFERVTEDSVEEKQSLQHPGGRCYHDQCNKQAVEITMISQELFEQDEDDEVSQLCTCLVILQ